MIVALRVARIHTLVNHFVPGDTFGVQQFASAQRDGYMNDAPLPGEEEQIAGFWLTLRLRGKGSNLLASIAGQGIACHAVTKLHEAAAIDALPGHAAPEIRRPQETPRRLKHKVHITTRERLPWRAHK